MRIDVLWTPSELVQMSVYDRVGVVVDVLRSGTSMAAALRNGARTIVPAASTEDAMRIMNSLGRDQVLLSGERSGVQIEGFDLGNSPAEFTTAAIGGRTIVMTTSNGTRALMPMVGARVVYICALVNLAAVAEQLEAADGNPLIVCAGREGQVSVEDALCAGLLVQAVLNRVNEQPKLPELGDGAVAALALAREHSPVTAEFLDDTAAGKALKSVGHGDDIEFCARVDSIPEVPVLRDRQLVRLRLAGKTSRGASEAQAR
jgi:2-phosphosulfolactate phosphatase